MMAMARAIMAIAMPGASIRPNAMTKTAISTRIAKMPAISPVMAMAMATSSTITAMALMAGMTASIIRAIPFTSMIGSAIAIAGVTATGAIGKIAAHGAMPVMIVGAKRGGMTDGQNGVRIAGALETARETAIAVPIRPL